MFFVNIDGFNNYIPQALKDDEIIEYDSQAGGYFITHDIYEEWALDKIIEREFCNKSDYKQFFNNMGDSLPIRRAFRDWLSEKLYIEDKEAKLLIEESIQNNDIEKHWKDEIVVSVLLSSYCSHFFEIFESELLKKYQQQSTKNKFQNKFQSHYEHGLLYKLLFLLRIACKEADEIVFDTYGLPKTDKNKKMFETIFMQPKGKGWNCLIENEDHKEFVKNITSVCLEKLFVSNEMTNSYELKLKFLEKFSCFILTLKAREIESYLKPFFDNFKQIRIPEYQEYFFSSFIFTEDKLNQYENFWTVWNFFYPKIIEICKRNIHDFDKAIIYNYLLAGPSWQKDAKDWHTLKEREGLFFKKVSKDIGHYPTVLYSISKLLNNIGSAFRDEGIFWISDVIKNNPDLSKVELEINTVFYIENIVRGYIFENRQIIKTKSQIKQQILIVLIFLIEKGSAIAYRLRENIL